MRTGDFARHFAILWLAGFYLLIGGCSTTHPASGKTTSSIHKTICELRLGEKHIKFDPDDAEDLRKLDKEIAAVLDLQKKQSPNGLGSVAKKYKRGLHEIRRLVEAIEKSSTTNQSADNQSLLFEVVAAVNNDQKQPIPEKVGVSELPWMFVTALHRPIGKGETPAKNLKTSSQTDLSLVDPLPSLFWQKPVNIANKDLYHGFEHTNFLPLETKICEYVGPKESYGTNPGFEVDCNGDTIKLKFGELSSEPLTARMFDALGFHADPTYYAKEVKIRYDRKMFQEFNSRRELQTRFTLFGWSYYTMRLQKHYDPFVYFSAVVLKDGRRWTGAELKAQLFRDAVRKHPELDAANFKPEVENQIDYLVTTAANVQPKDSDIKHIGSWDANQLNHADRRELRGEGVLAAWLGFFDTRFDNTRLRLAKHGNQEELLGYFSDLGGGMGETTGLLFMHGERPNKFPWTFTRPALSQGSGHLTKPLQIDNYRPMVPTKTMAEMTIDDARWMARLIGQMSERQIVEALIGAGYDSAEVRLYTEKLVSRRDRMIVDFKLSNEIPPLRPAGISREFSYDPNMHGPIKIRLVNGTEITAPIGFDKITNGTLISEKP